MIQWKNIPEVEALIKPAKEYCEKYDNERDCINALLKKMNIVED